MKHKFYVDEKPEETKQIRLSLQVCPGGTVQLLANEQAVIMAFTPDKPVYRGTHRSSTDIGLPLNICGRVTIEDEEQATIIIRKQINDLKELVAERDKYIKELENQLKGYRPIKRY